jgi:hypothetical protein
MMASSSAPASDFADGHDLAFAIAVDETLVLTEINVNPKDSFRGSIR